MRKTLIVPVLVIGVGVGWLLNALEILPVMDWLWSILLALTGILILLFGGRNKLTFLLGPSFLIGCCFSVLRQLRILPVKYEVPALMIAFGMVWMVVELSKLPLPKWAQAPVEANRS